MALDEILERIHAESDETASAVIASAHAEADELLHRAAVKAESERRRLADSLDDRARQEKSRIISRARLAAARERRAAREQIYTTALEGVKRRLREIRSSPEYEEILESLLDEAMAVLPGARVVRVDPEDVEVAQRLLAARGVHMEIETDEVPMGGVEVTAEGRNVDNTLITRLERADEHLRYVAGELVPALRGHTQ